MSNTKWVHIYIYISHIYVYLYINYISIYYIIVIKYTYRN